MKASVVGDLCDDLELVLFDRDHVVDQVNHPGDSERRSLVIVGWTANEFGDRAVRWMCFALDHFCLVRRLPPSALLPHFTE
jgi:hypothetical protein